MAESTPSLDALAKEVPAQQEAGSILKILEANKAEALAIEAAKIQLRAIIGKSKKLAGLVEDRLPVTSDFDQNTEVRERNEGDRRERRIAQSRIASGEGDEYDKIAASREYVKYDRITKSIQKRAGKLVGPDGRSVEIVLEKERSVFEDETDNGTWVPAVDSTGQVKPTYESLAVGRLSLTDPADEGQMILVYPNGIEVYGAEYSFPEFTIFLGGEKGLKVENLGDDRLKIPDRDPLDVTKEGLDYFLEHAAELKPVAPSTPTTPPTQPAHPV